MSVDSIKALTPDLVRPLVAYCNYMDVVGGTIWGPRTIPDMELVLVVAGRFTYETAEMAPLTARVGEVIVIGPEQRHTLREDSGGGRAAISCIHCELSTEGRWAVEDYRPDPLPPALTDTHLDPTIHDLFRRCAMEVEGFALHRDALLSSMVAEIWMRLARYWNRDRLPRLSHRVEEMLAYLRDHLTEGPSRDSLAHAFGLTPQHVNALFRDALGISPGTFVRRERMLAAYRCLREEELSVKETAARMGYEDPFYFSKVFKSVMGRPPSAVRLRH
ncbi:MAG: helix-turn-helix transcriptional regulator [Lentisphaerae bacterium]|nr:helix-turn-helix transcriptional regulator [Lentisphaerota bacterium]